MSEWQPIETAPRDGRDILIFDQQDQCMDIVFFRESSIPAGTRGKFIWRLHNDGGTIAEQVPTHWQRLPEPPGQT